MTPTDRRPSSLPGNLLLLIASIGVTLLAGELVARLVWTEPPPPQPATPVSEQQGVPKLSGVFTLAKPNIRGIHRGALYVNNSLGFRGREVTLQKPAGVFRIVLVGDSFVVGAGVLVEDTYATRLEEALNKRGEERRYEVLNLGLSGLSIEQIASHMENRGRRLDPDLIVYGFTQNDIEGPRYEHFKPKTVPGKGTPPILKPASPSYLVRILQPRWQSLRELISPPSDSYLRELPYNFFENSGAREDFLKHLGELARIAKEEHICIVMLIHSDLHHLHRWHPLRGFYDAVGQAAAERGYHVIQSLPAFMGRKAHSLWVSPTDTHPNPGGHAILAEALLQGLDALPEGCWKPRAAQGF